MEKTFTIQEANSLVPKIAGMFDEITELNKRMEEVSTDIESLLSIWGDELFDKENSDNSYYEAKIKERNCMAKEIHGKIHKIQETGAMVKDVKKGLVDFYFITSRGLVFLCWKPGESEILFWHSIENGYPGRRPVSELQQMVSPQVK
ncbi:MAG: DUF2203 domain-containing protein [Candidatus Aenigmarchaeota archaeon]|nr:DUF2203 domain-containing protein [Candidatus Aenigmarchaeota archaeon]